MALLLGVYMAGSVGKNRYTHKNLNVETPNGRKDCDSCQMTTKE